MKLPRAVLLAVVATLLSSTVPAHAQDEFEYGTSYEAADLLPANIIAGSHHRIGDKVQSDGFMFTYTVESEFGRFRATGDYAQQKLLNELQVIASLKEISRTEAFAKSIVHAAKSPLRFGEGLITDPVDTVTGIPRGSFSIFENVGEAVSSEQDPSEDGSPRVVLEAGLLCEIRLRCLFQQFRLAGGTQSDCVGGGDRGPDRFRRNNGRLRRGGHGLQYGQDV